MRFTIILCLVLCSGITLGQTTPACPCMGIFGKADKADRTFQFKNGKKIGLCGFIDTVGKQIIYSEFTVYECGQKNIVKEWDATKECLIEFKKDTLKISELYALPIGTNFSFVRKPFLINKLYYQNNILKDHSYFNPSLKKYSQAEILKVLEAYKKLKKNQKDLIILQAFRLFWAYVSGSKEAENHLINVKTRFGKLDGHNEEDLNSLLNIYSLYKKTNNTH
jgi:hypothetical protein